MDGDLCVVSAALTGVLADRAQCPAIPYTPAEIGEEARRAYEAGATVVHIHGREDDGTPTFRPDRFAEIKAEVTARSPVLLNFSTGTLDEDTTETEAIIRDVRPHSAALNMGTMNYARYSTRRKSFIFDMVFPNSFAKIERLLRAMVESGVHPEMECFDTGHTRGVEAFMDMGLLKPPMSFSFVMGVSTGQPPSVEAMLLQRGQLPPGSRWQVIGIGRVQWRLLALALALGGDIRVGLEDNFYLPDGEMASSNGVLVERAVRMAGDVGRRVATLDETGVLMGIKG